MPHLVAEARKIDPRCYYVVEDIRVASSAADPPVSDRRYWHGYLRGHWLRKRK